MCIYYLYSIMCVYVYIQYYVYTTFLLQFMVWVKFLENTVLYKVTILHSKYQHLEKVLCMVFQTYSAHSSCAHTVFTCLSLFLPKKKKERARELSNILSYNFFLTNTVQMYFCPYQEIQIFTILVTTQNPVVRICSFHFSFLN